MIFLNFCSLLATNIGIDYSSYDVRVVTNDSDSVLKALPNSLEVKDDGSFAIAKILNGNSVYYLIDLLENKNLSIHNKHILKSDEKGSLLLPNFETSIDFTTLSSLYAEILVEGKQYKNLVVAVRDYAEYQDDIIKSFSLKMGKTVCVLPSSLAYVINSKSFLSSGEAYSLIISMSGRKTVFSFYKILVNDKKEFENLFNLTLDCVSDDLFNELILNDVKKITREYLENSVFKEHDINIFPSDSDRLAEYSLDIMDIYKACKSNIMYNVKTYDHLESYIYSSQNPANKLVITQLVCDLTKTIKSIDLYIDSVKEEITNTVLKVQEEIKNKIGENIYTTEIITTFEYKKLLSLFDFPNIVPATPNGIAKGCHIYKPINYVIKDSRFVEKNVFLVNNHRRLHAEKKDKDLFFRTYGLLKDASDLKTIFEHLTEDELKNLESAFTVSENFSLASMRNANTLYNKFTILNGKRHKEKLYRPKKVEEIVAKIEKISGFKDSDPELWESGLGKSVNAVSEWFETYKNDENVTSAALDIKIDILDGYVDAYRNKLIQKKQKEKEEAEGNVETDTKKEDASKENKKVDNQENALEGFNEENFEEFRKQLTDKKLFNEETLKGFEESLKDKSLPELSENFEKMMKDDKFKKLFESLNQKESALNPEKNENTDGPDPKSVKNENVLESKQSENDNEKIVEEKEL